MASGFKINRQGIKKMTREIEKEFAKNPIRVPLEADSSGVSFPAGTSITNNYNGPVVTVNGDHAQVVWDSESVDQDQNISPGFEDLAKVLTELLASLPSLELSEEDAADLESNANEMLTEVVQAQPDRQVIKRGVTMLKGLLAPVAAGVGGAVSDESGELATTLIGSLSSNFPM